jgi:predicted dehydrogenase
VIFKTVEIFGEKGKAISANQQIAQWQVWKAEGQSTDAIKQSFKQRYHDAYVAELEEFHAIITGDKQDMSVVPADW